METPLSTYNRIIFHVDIDAFFASVEKVINPSLEGKPVIVGGQMGRGVVACPSYEARALGVKTAMPIAHARRIAPHAVFITGDFHNYRKFSEKFFDILFNLTDTIEPRSLDEAYIDVTHLAKNIQEGLKLAKELQNTIARELKLSVSIGVARNKVCAKVASDLRKPGGITVVQPRQEKIFLASLPIEKLPGIGKRTKEVLNNLGVYQIRHLANVPERILIDTFGKSGLMLSAFANGIDWRNVQKPEESKSISRSITFARDQYDPKIIKAEMYRLLERCTFSLRKEKRVANNITVTTRFADFSTYSRQQRMEKFTNIEKEIWPTVEKLFEKTMIKNQPVRMIGTGLSNLHKTHYQISLFDYPFSKIKNIQYALDKIRLQFGFEAIKTGQTFTRPVHHLTTIH